MFEAPSFIDPHGILTERARDHFRGRMRAFWRRRQHEGLSPLQIRDRWHRDVRMWRWVGQTRIADATSGLSANPLPSQKLLDRHLSLSLFDQRHGRVHSELMRRCNGWLWREPFAGAGFHPLITRRLGSSAPNAPARRSVDPQRAMTPGASSWTRGAPSSARSM